MAFYLRFLRNTKYTEWIEATKMWNPRESDFPARVLADWSEDSPSLWLVDDNKDNLNLVLMAFANKQREIKQDWKAYDYLLFREQVAIGASLPPKNTHGETDIASLDENCHFVFEGMTGNKVMKFLNALFSELSKKTDMVFVERTDKKTLNALIRSKIALETVSGPKDAPKH